MNVIYYLYGYQLTITKLHQSKNYYLLVVIKILNRLDYDLIDECIFC
jgi:hypothetical protein